MNRSSKRDLVLSFVMACGVVAGLLVVLDRSFHEPTHGASVLATSQSLLSASSRGNSVSAERDRIASERPEHFASIGPDQPTGQIFKCVVRGRTIYASAPCEATGVSEPLALHDTRGIISPPKESADALRAKRVKIEQQQGASSQVLILARPDRADCLALDERVAYLDTLARQPQSMSTQDWIRSERSKARDRQFGLKC